MTAPTGGAHLAFILTSITVDVCWIAGFGCEHADVIKVALFNQGVNGASLTLAAFNRASSTGDPGTSHVSPAWPAGSVHT